MKISTCARFNGGPAPPTSPRENPNPGREIAEHLAARLPEHGVAVRKVADLEFAHELQCDVSGTSYSVLVGYDWVTKQWWEVFYSPRLSWLRRLFGASEEAEMRALTRALAAALSSLPKLGQVRWYRSYAAGPSGYYTPWPEA